MTRLRGIVSIKDLNNDFRYFTLAAEKHAASVAKSRELVLVAWHLRLVRTELSTVFCYTTKQLWLLDGDPYVPT